MRPGHDKKVRRNAQNVGKDAQNVQQNAQKEGKDAQNVRQDVQNEGKVEIKVPCQVMSRVCGYISSVNYWHKCKKAEWADRRPYRIQDVPQE